MIQSQTNSISYTGNGVTASFAYTFLIQSNTWLQIYVDGILQTLTTNYTVTNVNSPSGGNVVFNTAPANLAKIVIARTGISITQLLNYIQGDKFIAQSHEAGLDKLTAIVQQLQSELGKTLQIHPADTLSGNKVLGYNINRNDRILMFDAATGDLIPSDKTFTFLTEQIDNFSQYIAQGTSLKFPLDLGFIEDQIIYFTYDLGGLS